MTERAQIWDGTEWMPMTGVVGAGTLELIETITVAGAAQTNIEFSAIPNTYDELVLIGFGRSDGAAAATDFYLRVGDGSIDSGTNYGYTAWRYGANDTSHDVSKGATNVRSHTIILADTDTDATDFSRFEIRIHDYADTSKDKHISWTGGGLVGGAGTTAYGNIGEGIWRDAGVIDEVQIYLELGDWVVDTEVSLYGYTRAGIPVGGAALSGTSTVSSLGSSTSINTTSHSLPIPAGTDTGDLMLVFSASRNSTIAEPSGGGWTEILVTDTASNEWLKVWHKTAGASESTVTVASSGVICGVGLVVLTGVNATTPIYDSSYVQASVQPPILETENDKFTLYYFVNAYLGGVAMTKQTGTLGDSYTEEFAIEHTSGHDSQVMVLHRDSRFTGVAAPLVGGKAHQYQYAGTLIISGT